MSIKDLFGKTSPNLEETVQDVESVAFVEEKTKADQTYHPQIDFSDPENFVYYGSAELYYDAAIRRIYEDYPYDGSKAEQIAFEESASALERWVFENKYPRSTGHVQLGTTGEIVAPTGGQTVSTTTSPEAIRVWGGLHTDSSTNLKDKFSKSAKFDEDKNRNQNWNCDFEKGVTIEFFLKKDFVDFATNPAEFILDLWNGKTGIAENRLLIWIESNGGSPELNAMIVYGGGFHDTKMIIPLLEWSHCAITFHLDSGTMTSTSYLNGEEQDRQETTATSTAFEGLVNGFIGCLQTPINGQGSTYGGKFQGYLDEFRFWKTRRTARQIKLNWFQPIGGGANTDDATSDLGVYLKFNEGIVGNNQIDNVVLDYSGRLANGLWIGYENTTNARSTISAMEQLGYAEKPSPIIYKEHPSVSALISEMQTSGSVYDADRGQSFFRSMPTWLQEEDNGNLRLFSQILGSYMDTLHVQIKELTELKTKRYPMEGVKASTMAADLLKDKGFMISNMFESNEVYEKLAAVNLQDAQFETELHEIKNIIYTNIYNNLEKIYKTKGTEGSIRNLIRCYGIDDELIRLNLYTDGGIHYFTDKSRPTSVKKKYVNFNDPSRFDASIYQVASSLNPNSFISDAVDASKNAFTMEVDIVVPYKKEVDEKGYFSTPFLSSSVMGFHEANTANATDFTWQLNGNDMQVYLVRDSEGSRHAKFVMQGLGGTINEESDYIYDIYENEHYNVALRIKPQTYPYTDGTTTPDYDIELYAVTTNFGEIEKEVLLSTSVSNAIGVDLMNASKRIYVGAHVENFTGSNVLQQTDLQFGGVRAWLDYLDNSEILNHNKDVLNYGQRSSIDGSNLYIMNDVQIPTQDLTILNWDFDTVTATDAVGEFEVEDITSGSTNRIYGWIDDIIRREHKAKGSDFASNDSSIIDYEFIQAYKKQLPESAYDAQNIYIKGDQEINFSDDDDVSDNLFILEKSPAALISEEMLKSFSTTLEFANLIGRPVERFRVEYKDLAKARQLFFEKVESDMDFDRFFEYFKWIDSSISSMVNQLIPMSANFAGGIVDVIEPHILERDKYQRQIGLLNTVTSTEASIRGVQEMKYSWRVGHAPLSGDENENCLWQKERKENDVVEEEAIRQVLVRQNDQEFTNPVVLSGSTQLISGSYAARRFSRPYELGVSFSNSIHGGINYSQNKDRDMITDNIRPRGNTQLGAPENVVLIGEGAGIGLNPMIDCRDEFKFDELKKIKADGFAVLGKHSYLQNLEPKTDNENYIYRQKVSKIVPGNIVSSSVNTGYSAIINKSGSDGGFSVGYDLVNLHSDTTDITNEIPIQGPFSETHVGGRQSRHIHFMDGADPALGYITSSYDRPEFWNIYVGALSASSPNDGAIGFTGPDYSIGNADTDSQKAIYYREERAKRPVNIKNIQTIIGTGSHGNFTYNYEVMSTFGDQGYYLRRVEDLLPQSISSTLPETTNYHTLIAQTASAGGNYFGDGNNRQFNTIVETPVTNASFNMIFDSSVPPDAYMSPFELTIQRANYIPNSSIDDTRAIVLDFDPTNTNGVITRTADEIRIQIQVIFGDWVGTLANLNAVVNSTPFSTYLSNNTPSAYEYVFTESVLLGDDGNGGSISQSNPNALLFLQASFIDGTSTYENIGSNIVETQDRSTGSANVIRTRFSAPGGPEINSSGYLDVATQQYSVHNSLNFRNLTTRASGSGESDKIRLDTHQVSVDEGKREGLRTLRARHQGRFGIESQYGAVSATDYVSDASFHKQHRNNQEKISPVDKLSRAISFANTSAEYAGVTPLDPDGEVIGADNGISFSLWVKFDATTPLYRGIIDNQNFKMVWIDFNNIIRMSFQSGLTWHAADFDISSFDMSKWRQIIASCDVTDLSLCKMTIDGIEAPLISSGVISPVYPILPFNGFLNLGVANPAPSTIKYPLAGSMMNFAYFNFFIHNDPEAIEIITNHTRRDEIDKIRNLINFWFLGDETSLNIGDTIPDQTKLDSMFGRYVETLVIQNASSSPNFNIDGGFYTYVDGERQGDERFDNDHFHSLLPASDFGYSWVHSTLSGSDSSGATWESKQRIVDFAPRNGQVAVRGYGYVPAIVFPTISDVSCCIGEGEIEVKVSYLTKVDGSMGTNTVSDDITLEVRNTVHVDNSSQITDIYINDMTFEAATNGCCDDLEYRITAEDDGDPQKFEDTGYQSTPPSPPSNIVYDEALDPGTIILTFYAKDCYGNIDTLVVTLDKAIFNQ